MKKMLRIAAALAALLAMTNFIGCKNDDDDGGDETVAVTEVKITSTVKEVTAGETITLEATVSPENATNKTVTWTSSDTAIATVDSTGKVAGVAAGTATITAKAGEKTAAVEVTVKAAATSGGETGTTTGFENTYWVLEKTSFEESGFKVTLENLEYIYIKDSTSGSCYTANPEGVIKGLSESSVGTHNLDYEEPITFTYTVDGSNVTIKMGEETMSAVIVDENSFSTTDKSTATTYTYTKVAAAPTKATVTVEVTAAPSTGVNAAWDFNVASLTAAGLTTTAAKPTADKEIAVTSGSGATLTLLAQNGKSLKIQNAETGGLNVGAGSTETEVLSITVENACTLKFNCKGSSGSTFSTTKPNSFSVNGTKVYERASADETSYQEFTYPITEAGTYKIAASGMIFTALTCE